MILDNHINSNVVVPIGEAVTTAMEVDMSNKAFIMDLFSQGIYSDAIGSLIRETVSNSLDANKESGSDLPVLVSFKKDENYQYWFKSMDSGIGISPDRMNNIVSKYFGSTKRHTNEFLGGFGLGFKSPLAYCNSFFIITINEGTLYKYMMYKAGEGTAIDLMHTEQTDLPSGTTIEIPVESTDYGEFVNKMQEQLCYMENVYMDVPGEIDNDFFIEKSEFWKYSSLNTDDYLHLSLDNVYYQLDFDKLGLPTIKIPIALCFKVGEGLIPTPNRESIRYTEQAKTLIKNRLELVTKELIAKYKEQSTESDDFLYFNRALYHKKYNLNTGNTKIDIIGLIKYAKENIPPVLIKGINHIKYGDFTYAPKFIHEYLFSGFYINSVIRKGNRYSKDKAGIYRLSNYLNYTGYDNEKPDYTLLFLDENIPSLKMKYLQETYQYAFIIGKENTHRKLFTGDNSYVKILELDQVPRRLWRTHIQEFQLLQKYFMNTMVRVSEIEVPESFILANKKERVVTKVKQEYINPKWAYELGDIRSGNAFSFKHTGAQAIDSFGEDDVVIYGTEARLQLTRELATLMKGSSYEFCIMVDRDIKKIENNKSFINILDFLRSDDRNMKHTLNVFFCYQYIKSDWFYKLKYLTELIYMINKTLSEYITTIDNIGYHYTWGEVSFEEISAFMKLNKSWIDPTIYQKTKYIDCMSNSLKIFNKMDRESLTRGKEFVVEYYRLKFPTLIQ